MKLKDKLRVLLFNILGAETVDKLRFLKFSYKFSRFSRIKDRNIFTQKFSQFYEPEMQLIPKILKNPKIIIDVGANYGPYSFFLSKLYPESKIFSFEPATRSYNIFKRIIKKFNLTNVIPIRKGLGLKDEDKEIVMPLQYTILAYVSDENTKRNKEDKVEKIEITTLDNFVKRNKIKDVDFIKCDVEGFELNVFKGARKTIKKFKSIILVEIEERHTKKYDINSQDVLKFFKKIGYNSYSVKDKKIEKNNMINKKIPLYLFIHKNKSINNS